MDDAALVSIAIATLPLARTDEELNDWWRLNQSWIPTIKASDLTEYGRLIEAAKAARARIASSAQTSKTASSTRS